MVREAMQYGGLIATARNSVLKTGGTASNRMGIDTSALRQLNKDSYSKLQLTLYHWFKSNPVIHLSDKSPSRQGKCIMSLAYATLVKWLRRQSAKLVFSSSNLESSSIKDRITAIYNILQEIMN